MQDAEACPFCSEKPVEYTPDHLAGLEHYECSACGSFHLREDVREDYVDDRKMREQFPPLRLSCLLRERFIAQERPLAIHFPDYPDYENPKGSTTFDVVQALTSWPDSVPERLDRVLVNLGRIGPSPGARLDAGLADLALWFAETRDESKYAFTALKDFDWIQAPNFSAIQLLPAGWERFDELTRGGSSKENHVFVAMWYGEDKERESDRREEMRRLYDDAIAPAVEAAGYRVMRADSEAHNRHIMNQMLADIRRAPFVVADLTHHTNGVYYETGFASGLGIEVIHCCPDEEAPSVHFDLQQMSQVRYAGPDDLREKLQAHIEGSVGEGPHKG